MTCAKGGLSAWRKIAVAAGSALVFSLLLYEFTSTFWLGRSFRFVTEFLIALLAGSITALASEFVRSLDGHAGKNVRWALTLTLTALSLFSMWKFYRVHSEWVKPFAVSRNWWIINFDELGTASLTYLIAEQNTNRHSDTRPLPETTLNRIPAFLDHRHGTIFLPDRIDDEKMAEILLKYTHHHPSADTKHRKVLEDKAIQWSLDYEPRNLVDWAATKPGRDARAKHLLIYMLWQISTVVFLSAAWGTCPGKGEVATDLGASTVVDQLAKTITRA